MTIAAQLNEEASRSCGLSGKWSASVGQVEQVLLGGTWKTTAHPTGLSLDVNNTVRQSMTLCATASWWGGSRVPYLLWTYDKLDCHFTKNHGSLAYFGHAFSKTSPFKCKPSVCLTFYQCFTSLRALFLSPTWFLNKIQPPWSKWYNFTRPWDTKVTAKCEAHVQLASAKARKESWALLPFSRLQPPRAYFLDSQQMAIFETIWNMRPRGLSEL